MTPEPRCDLCPLKPAAPWAPQQHDPKVTPDVALVYSVPTMGDQWRERGDTWPLSGQGGFVLYEALEKLGLRERVMLIPVVACSLEMEQTLDLYESRSSSRFGKKEDEEDWYRCSPSRACASLFRSRLEGYDRVICLGKEAAEAVKGSAVKISKVRGSFEKGVQPFWRDKPLEVAITLDPYTLPGQMEWVPTFERDLAKFFRYFDGTETWVEPEVVIPRTVKELWDALQRLSQVDPIAIDTETDSLQATECTVRCIGLSDQHLSVVIPFYTFKDPEFTEGHYWPPHEEERVKAILRAYLRRELPFKPRTLVAHNGDVYDFLVIRGFLGIDLEIDQDSMPLHVLADNEMPHGLGYIGSDALYSDYAEAWKADHTATEAKTNRDLWKYCGKDCILTSRIIRPVYKLARANGQLHLLDLERQLRSIGREMQALGMKIDQGRVQHYREEARTTSRNAREEIHQIIPGLNPNSHLQMGKLLFREWKLSPVSYSEITGEPSTGDETLRMLIMRDLWAREGDDEAAEEWVLTPEQSRVIFLVRQYRKMEKRVSSLAPLVPSSEFFMASNGEKRPGLILRDGRIHPSYSRLASSGRFTSGGKNTFNGQNIDRDMRDIVVPEEGHCFVYIDVDGLELRSLAEEAGIRKDLETIEAQQDAHCVLMHEIYGDRLWEYSGAPTRGDLKSKGSEEGEYRKTRDGIKNVRFASQYKGGIEAVFTQATQAEDKNGNLLFPHLRPRLVGAMMRNIIKKRPEMKAWWERIEEQYHRQGYIETPLWKRKRKLRAGFKITEAAAHINQGKGAEVCHESVLQVVFGQEGLTTYPVHGFGRPIPFDLKERTGMVNYTHDSNLIECKRDDAGWVAESMAFAFNRRLKVGAKLTYTAKPKIVETMQ